MYLTLKFFIAQFLPFKADSNPVHGVSDSVTSGHLWLSHHTCSQSTSHAVMTCDLASMTPARCITSWRIEAAALHSAQLLHLRALFTKRTLFLGPQCLHTVLRPIRKVTYVTWSWTTLFLAVLALSPTLADVYALLARFPRTYSLGLTPYTDNNER